MDATASPEMLIAGDGVTPLQDGSLSAGACFLCGIGSGPIVVRENGYNGRACACGIVYLDPNPPEDAVDPTYDQHPDDYYSLPARLRLSWVREFRTNGRLLEVGCGAGHFLAVAQEAGYEVSAIEPHPDSALHVTRNLNAPVEECLIEETTLPRGRFDIVFHVDLLSHFP